MANLLETTGETFPAARQIENGEMQAGGPSGLWNEHAKTMIERTNYLRRLVQVAGLDGDDYPDESDLDNIEGNGFFQFQHTAVGAPDLGHGYDAAGIQIYAPAQTVQIASLTEAKPLVYRIKDTTTWGPWLALIDERTGIGGNAPVEADFNTVAKSGFFSAGAATPGAPRADRDYRGIHITSDNGEEFSQMAFGSDTEVHFRDKDAPASPWSEWRTFLHDKSAKSVPYASANAPDGWVISANIKGDTAITLGAVSGSCLRLGNLAHLMLQFDIAAFSVPASDDSSVTLTLDLAAIGVAAGWFATVAATSFGLARGKWVIAATDVPPFPLEVSAATNGTLYLENTDTTILPAQGSPATGLEVRLNITMIVGD